jgi:hypothetical protein
MSHFTKLEKANIVDADSFIEACRELGLTNVKTNVTIKDYYGAEQHVDVAVNVGRYDIALVKNGDKYDLTGDWWGVQRCELPQRLAACRSESELQDLILQRTTAHTVASRYRRQGYRVNMWEDEEQNLQIDLTRVR